MLKAGVEVLEECRRGLIVKQLVDKLVPALGLLLTAIGPLLAQTEDELNEHRRNKNRAWSMLMGTDAERSIATLETAFQLAV